MMFFLWWTQIVYVFIHFCELNWFVALHKKNDVQKVK